MENINVKKALIVDENITQRKTIISYLKNRFECTDCATPAQALQLLHDHYFDLVITEKEFESVENKEYLGQIKQIQNQTRVIMMTGYPDEAAVFLAAQNEVDSILVKPINCKTLFGKIDELMSFSLVPQKTSPLLSRLNMRIQKIGHYAIISLVGRLVSTTFPNLKASISNLLKRGVKNIALNLEKLTEIDQYGFRLILSTFKQLKGLSGSLCLFNVLHLLSNLTSQNELMEQVPVYLEEGEFKENILKEFACGMSYPHRG